MNDIAASEIEFPHSPILALRGAVERGAPGYFSADDGRMGFAELERRSNQFAKFLSRHGIAGGDRVAALSDNRIDTIVAMFGAMKLGAIWAPINTAYRGEWLRHQLTDSEPAALIVESAYIEPLTSALDSIPRCLLVSHERSASLPQERNIDFDGYLVERPDAPGYAPKPGDASHLIYTSGTTGRSKGCLISHNYLCNYARLLQQNAPRRTDEVLYSPLPLFHLAATAHLVLNLVIGAGAHFARRFSVSTFWDDVERYGAGYLHLMGTMASMLATAPDTPATRRCFGKVRVLASAWSSSTAIRIKERFGIDTSDLRMFGQTEGALITTLRGHPLRDGTIGLPNDSFDVRIVDEGDREVPCGQVGEIVYRPLKPDVMFSGYWRNPQATWEKCRNLWWHSGDFGWKDKDGYVFFTDRGDDRLRRGGENISSFELEQAFLSHPAVEAVAAHAVPCELGEDDVKVVVVLHPGESVAEQELWTWAAPRVPRFALPRYIEMRRDLPRNAMGKVLKYKLRREGITPATWDRVAAGVTFPVGR